MNHLELVEREGIKLCAIEIKLIQEDNPLEMSLGGRNTVYHPCEVYQGRPSYASCLTVINKIRAGNELIKTLRPECVTAVENGTCKAMGMRKEEELAGRALFFVDYLRMREERDRAAALALLNSPIKLKRSTREGMPRGKPVEVEAPQETPQIKTSRAPTSADPYNTNIAQRALEKVIENERN